MGRRTRRAAEECHAMHNNEDVEPWRSRVPPGVPGAGWVVATIFAFAIVVFTGWWWEGSSHSATAAPAAAHSTR
jgi:hypothetical protein